MNRYIRAWWLLSTNSFQTALENRWAAAILILGKVIRFAFFFFMLLIVLQKTRALQGYNTGQIIFFFLTFNLIDIAAQFLYREVYRFRPLIVSGDFDLVLAKPIHPLLRVLLGGADPLDLVTLVPLALLIIYFGQSLGPLTPMQIASYLFLIINALLIATAFHIAVLAFGIVTTSVDHTIMIYRDLTNMGRIPIDFYNQFIRALLTFVIPVGVMMTVPAKALMGLLAPEIALFSFGVGILSLYLALAFWNWSLSRYSSASS